MNLVFIIPSLGSGGAERVLSGLANDWISRKKCTIEIIVLMDSKDFYHIDERIKIHRLNYSAHGSLKLFNLIKLLLNLRSLIKLIKPDVCFSFIRQSNILTLLATKYLNCKVVITERDSPNAFVSKVYRYLRKKLYPSCSGIIVQTQEYKRFVLNEIGHLRLVVIPNPVRDIDTKNTSRENIIISVGRLIPVKGHKYLLEAFSKCKNKDDWKLVILGDGVLKNDLLKQAKELNIQDKVKLLGATKNVDEWLSKSSIFAFTSTSEGFPNALAEGMSACLPCVSFDCTTGPRDLIKPNHSGYLVEVGDIDNFALNLDILIENSNLRNCIGYNAKEMANSLNFYEISNRYFDFLTDIYYQTNDK
ncbi:glycosyltransferase family 4 protein [Acinetobacter indicus]|uniref:glycosyltransferase family 4 protein n=1 Tax=Acinetobacter indicus TaxID=756892 RepID=UPI001443BB0A|nr:glycosyltransferase family 4 protein [Acinetobacter indicus]